MATVEHRIHDLERQIQGLLKDTQNNQAARSKLLELSKHTSSSLANPADAIFSTFFDSLVVGSATTVSGMRIPQHVCNASSPMSADQLAQLTGYDVDLIVRLMRPLTAKGYFIEVDEATYSPNPITHVLADPGVEGGMRYIGHVFLKSVATMPEYLLDPSRSNASGTGMFQHALKTEKFFFDYMNQFPRVHEGFDKFMKNHRTLREDWFNHFHPQQVFGDGASKDPEAPLFVDVAGGNGHQCAAIRQKLTEAPGKWILEDLPETIDGIQDLDSSIVRLKHDFFKPQPIKGARVYYLRSIMHDWPDRSCVEILKNIAVSMKKGYSKILIDDFIMPTKGASVQLAALDLAMMIQLEGAERTPARWRKIISQAGLKIVSMRNFGLENDGLIEAVLNED